MTEPIIYAIGDVHGEAERLRQLHQYIFERHAISFEAAPIRIVHLGDYIDRGPDSFGVISEIIALRERGDCEVINLKGNHEQMLLNAVDAKSEVSMSIWLENGGKETLESYHQRGHDSISQQHLDWIRELPTLFSDKGSKTVFVHAGVDVAAFPHCSENVRLWTRSPSFFDADGWDNPQLSGWRVVHGHTPTDDYFPEVAGDKKSRINLDTGAVFGGRLTAGVFAPGQPPKFMYA